MRKTNGTLSRSQNGIPSLDPQRKREGKDQSVMRDEHRAETSPTRIGRHKFSNCQRHPRHFVFPEETSRPFYLLCSLLASSAFTATAASLSSSPADANFAIDPWPHVPHGFEIVPRDPNALPSRLYAYIGRVMDAYNEDLAIAFLLPTVAKEDFQELAEALKSFFIQNMGTRLNEFGHGYTLRFIKHDEGTLVRMHDLDREVWIMLMLFPNDARNNSALAKACAGFGLLRYWYDSTNNARVVYKAVVEDEASHSAHGPSSDVAMSEVARELEVEAEKVNNTGLEASAGHNAALGTEFMDNQNSDDLVAPALETIVAMPENLMLHSDHEDLAGMVTGYLQMQPGAVSTAALLELDEDHDDSNV
ncbi:hypothetical protein HU200_033699 [Digitaria exilis]|uniref:Uncharacterized protein n=1 Tax=Digitaria exilis TaxID=1010633 RepID=A0A835BUY8_9POAL|nr:hypothetical protein HU200_033699 [Digitaria exilis]